MKLFKYLRIDEWISSKVTMMLGTMAYFICLNKTRITDAMLELSVYFLFLFALSAVCYILNDFFDIEIDKKAGKKKIIAGMPKWVVWLTVIAIASAGTVPVFIFSKNVILCSAIVFLNYLFGVCYSVPGLRFKERSVWGLIECSLAQHCVPLSVLFLFERIDGLNLILWGIWFVLSFMNGLRYILIHQYIDRENDRAADVHTFVADSQVGIKKIIVALCCLEGALGIGLLAPLFLDNVAVICVGVLLNAGLEFCIYEVLNVFAKKDWMVSFDSVPLEAFFNIIMPIMFGICMMKISIWGIAFSAFILLCCLRALAVKIGIALVYVKSKLTTKREGKKMEISVYCSEQNKDQAVGAIKEKFKKSKITFADYEKIPSGRGLLVVGHEFVHTLKSDEAKSYKRVFVFFKNNLYDLSRARELADERKRCLDGRDWQRAKDINEVLCDFDFLSKNKINNSYPEFIQIESTDFCNSKCIMCEHFFSHSEQCKNLETHTLEKMRDVFQLSRTVNLNGMGEPFISKYLTEQIDFYVVYGNKIVSNTNLSILSDELIERLNAHFEWLAISIDGAKKETYESIRIGLKYDTLIENLNLLKQKAPDLKKIISTVVMRQNVTEMPEIVELAHRFSIDRVTFFPLTPSTVIGNKQDSLTNYPKVLEYYSVKALEAGEKYGIRVIVSNGDRLNRDITFDEIKEELEKANALPMWKTEEEQAELRQLGEKVHDFIAHHAIKQNDTVASSVKCRGVCDWLLKNCYVNLEGDVSMCCRNALYCAGNVKDGFVFVWNSPLMQKAREIFYSGFVPESCLKCGMIECGELKYLSAEITEDFYKDPKIAEQQKRVFAQITGTEDEL